MAPKQISRRNFLKIIAVGAMAGATAKLGLDALSVPERVSATRLLMGTVVNLTIVSDDRVAAQSAIETTLARMSELESVLSRFQPESQLSQLNRSGHLDDTSPALLGLITQAQTLSNLSGGAFDITVKPLVDLYQRHQAENGELPPAAEIEAALALVDYRQIQVDGAQIAFAQPRMSITLDGIAKGYIVDEGVSVLKALGFDNVLVEAGGDLLASGQKSAEEAWQIGVQSPRKAQSGLLEKLAVKDKAVATSGDYMQAFSADMRQHHIIDPRTGYSAPELAGATIMAPSAMLADGLATAVMVLGSQDGLALVEKLSGCSAYLADKNLKVFKMGV
jgi:thiamine biosynthesis lipoprotein